MVRDRLLKVKLCVLHIDQDRGVDFGNKHLECHWGHHWEKK